MRSPTCYGQTSRPNGICHKGSTTPGGHGPGKSKGMDGVHLNGIPTMKRLTII